MISKVQSSNSNFYIQYSNEKQSKHFSGATHFHDCYEFFYLLDNKLMYHIDNNVYYIEPGTIVIVPPNIVHTTQYLNQTKRKRILINLPTEYIHSFLLDDPELLKRLHVPPFSIDESEREKIENLLYSILNEFNKPMANAVLIKSFLGQLLVNLGELSKKNLYSNISNSNNKTTQQMLKIINYISEHYYENITLASLSKIFFLSPSYISRSLKENLNISFSEYLRTVRIKEACQLLENTSLKLEEIAEKVGFSGSSDLCRTFKSIMHTTPAKYKESCCSFMIWGL